MFMKVAKDGGKESHVWGLFLIELKKLFSIVLLKFTHGTREAYHSHAFNSISWVLWGQLTEFMYNGEINIYRPSLKPVMTYRDTFHKVSSVGNTYVITFRGPWVDTWYEYVAGRFIRLTHGRKVC